MAHGHARDHGRHRGSHPVLAVAVVIVALFGSSLLAIVWLLHQLALALTQIFVSMTSYLLTP